MEENENGEVKAWVLCVYLEHDSAWFVGLLIVARARQQKHEYDSKMPTQQNKGPAAKQGSCSKMKVLQQNEGYGSKSMVCYSTAAKWMVVSGFGMARAWALGVHFSTHACYSDIEVVAHAIPAMHPCLPVEMTRLLYSM
ncbi:hypothetical protein Pyn_23361 [Prunus yedoensis var. nudiflora]|uniref:Uncharacterized protein n=1 Tax=Prunus yedoensis var. nudiflora TaxID=2094558 RepID=A0A314URA2_PRUYE|nr:hypothetical protein Pyn_23361 [Prunus yedoensis var. nudiflora]